MRAKLGTFFGLALALAFGIWAVHVLTERWGQLPALDLKFLPVSVAVLLTWLVVAINSSMVEYTARLVGRGLGHAAAQRLGIIVTLFNYFLPMRAGLVLRLTQYVRAAGQDPVRLTAALFASALIVQAVGIAVLLVCLYVIREISTPIMLAALAAVLSMGAMTWWAGISRDSAPNWLDRAIKRIREGSVALLRNGPRPFMVLTLLSLATLLATAWRYQLVLGMFGAGTEFLTVLALAAGTGLSSLISVTFGGLGVREAAVVLVGSYCGLPAETCLLMALLDRVIVSASVAVAGVPILCKVKSITSIE